MTYRDADLLRRMNHYSPVRLLQKKVNTYLRRIRKQEQRIHELEILQDVSEIINASLDMKKTLKRILTESKRLIPYDMATVQLLRGSEIRVIGGIGFPDHEKVLEMRFPYPEEGSLSTYAIQSGSPVMTNAVELDFPQFQQPENSSPIRSWIGIPLIRKKITVGLMALDSLTPGVYSSRHLELAGRIARHITNALSNACYFEEINAMAMQDPLTGLYNRNRFKVEAEIHIKNTFRTQRCFTLAMFDLDYFKKVNDTYGHLVGDEVLKRIAGIFMSTLRNVDVVARYGGEEFVVLFPETDDQAAKIALERMRSTLEALIHPELKEAVTVSIGYTVGDPFCLEGLESMMSKADEALYRAKRNGRNRIEVYR